MKWMIHENGNYPAYALRSAGKRGDERMANDSKSPADEEGMSIRIRFYTTDIDLIALYAAGYPLPEMMRKAVIACANGRPLRFRLDRAVDFDFNRIVRNRGRNRAGTTSTGTQAQIMLTIKDPVAVNFCRTSIKSRYRCKFLKMLLRYSLMGAAPIGAYLTDEEKRDACASYFLSFENGPSDVLAVAPGPPRRILADSIADKERKKNRNSSGGTAEPAGKGKSAEMEMPSLNKGKSPALTGAIGAGESKKAGTPQAIYTESPPQNRPLSDDTRHFITFHDIKFDDEED